MKLSLLKNSILTVLLVFFVIQTERAFSAAPLPTIISSFSPLSAEPGATVTITGSGFNATPALNLVYFGAVKGTVTAGTETSLTVTVPVGSTYAPINITNTGNNTLAASSKYFQPRFSPRKKSFIDTDLAPVQVFAAGTNTTGAAFGDLDGDGKPEIVAVNKGSNTVSILQNNSTIGVITAGSFSIAGTLTTGTSPEEVYLGDMNMDGKLDIVVNNSGDNNVSVFMNNSSGTGNFIFLAKVDFATGVNPTRMALGDIDGDGRLDVVTTNKTDNTISVLRNSTGFGIFHLMAKVDFATGTEPLAISIGDLDQDGKMDIATVNYLSNTVSVFRNTSTSGTIDGTSLAAAQSFAVGGKPQGIAIGDLDGDAKPDITTTYWAGSGIQILPNTSSGSGNINFATSVGFAVGSSTYWVSLGDMNGDGKLDIIATDANGFDVISNNTTTGNITTAGFPVKTRFYLNSYPRAVIGDLDGDGKPEIVATNATVSVYRNTLQVPPTISAISALSAAPGTAITITGTDFDPTASNNIVSFGEARAIPTTISGTTSLTVTVPYGAGLGALKVFNKTNNTIAYSSQYFQPAIFPWKSSFSSTDLATKLDFAAGTTPNTVSSADMDGDGKLDIIVANRTSNKISVLLNSASSGAFAAGSLSKTEIDPSVSLRHVTIGDVNMDGKPDIIFSLASDDYVKVMINTSTVGNLSFSTSSNFHAGHDNDNITSISIHDIDSDGKPDIIATLNATSGNLRILRNTSIAGSSTVSFTSGSSASFHLSGTRARRIAIGDLDGDGKPEIIAAFYTLNYTEGGGSKVSVLKNESSPGLIKFNNTQTFYTTGTGPYDVALGDLDGDGKLDIITSNLANGAGNTVSILRNTGAGFADFQGFSTGGQPSGIALADMNGDGKPEIITSNINPVASSVSILNNNSTSGSLAFSTNLNFTSGVLPNVLLVNDLDSDGKPEIITGNYTDNTISVFKNTLEIPAPVISSFTPTSAKSGTTVTITGTSFLAASSVKFGGLEATSYTVVSPTSITAVLAAGNSGDISVTTPSGTATLAGFSFLKSDATLASISLSSGTLSPVFASGTIAYTATVGNLVSSITVSPTLNEVNATVKVNGTAVVSGNASASIPLTVGSNEITILVTAQDGSTTKTYTLTITRAQSSDATLASISLSSGALNPVFASGTLAYTATVSNAVNSITVTPTSGEANATLKVNGTTVVSGNASASIPLTVGPNEITFLVTAQDGTIKTYTLNLTRSPSNDATLASVGLSSGTLSPVFASGTLAYTATVNNVVNSITVTPTSDEPNAILKVNGTLVVSGNASTSIPLTVGSNEVTVLVTAQDGTTTKSYIISITRAPSNDATLASVSLSSGNLSPVFASGTLAYTATVNNAVNSITVTPTSGEANAILKVNGTLVVSGNASTGIPLTVGSNVITVLVTAQDGSTTKSYTLTITRAQSSDATLASVSLSSGTLSPVFASGTLAYTATVNNAVNSITVTPTSGEANAILKVNGTLVVSGNSSTGIPLTVGSNVITMLVIAQDGSTSKSYTLTVTREISADANLSSLSITGGSLSPSFNAGVTAYSTSLPNNISAINVTPTASSSASSIKINGLAAPSGSSSGPYNMVIGENTISIEVKAANGTLKTYSVRVNREPDPIVNVTLNNSSNNVQITSPVAPVTVNIATGTSSPVINYNALVSGGTVKVPETNINSDLAKITIPASTNIKGSTAAWNGELSGPVASSYDLPKVPGEITTTGIAIEVGSPDVSLSFDRGVRILLIGQAGMRVAWVHQNIYTEISTIGSADSQAAADLLPANGAFKIDVGPDLVIWTKGFSRFITFSQSVDLNVAVVAADREAITADVIKGTNAGLNHIMSSLVNPLPSIGAGGSQITWQSGNSAVLSSDGKLIARPALGSANSIVNLTATIKKGAITETKTFVLSVLPLINEAPTLSAIADQTICYTTSPQIISLTGTSPGAETRQTITFSVSTDKPALFSQLRIDPISKELSYVPANVLGGTAIITVTVKDDGGTLNGGIDTYSRTFNLKVNPLPNIDLSSSLGNEISKGQLTELRVTYGLSYTWFDDNGIIVGQNSSTLSVRPEVNTRYTVRATNANGCVSSASIFIQVTADYNALQMNNLLSPNADGYNDALVIKNLDMYPDHTLKIFDRSGRIIYQKQNYQNDWTGTFQGTPLTEGTYYYVFEFESGEKVIKGFVSIVN